MEKEMSSIIMARITINCDSAKCPGKSSLELGPLSLHPRDCLRLCARPTHTLAPSTASTYTHPSCTLPAEAHGGVMMEAAYRAENRFGDRLCGPDRELDTHPARKVSNHHGWHVGGGSNRSSTIYLTALIRALP